MCLNDSEVIRVRGPQQMESFAKLLSLGPSDPVLYLKAMEFKALQSTPVGALVKFLSVSFSLISLSVKWE